MNGQPRDFWGNPTFAKHWVEQDKRYKRDGINDASEQYISIGTAGFPKVLEVGSGTGRLISRVKGERHAIDINPALIKQVSKLGVHGVNAPATDIPFEDDSFDLVYTYQCIQHIPNNELATVLREIWRVAKDEVWLMEGFVAGKEQGERTHKADGGSFVYYLDKILVVTELNLSMIMYWHTGLGSQTTILTTPSTDG